jgi:hypothetical protein
VTEVEFVTGLVVTVKVAELAPAGTVTLAGSVATAVLLIERVTATPPEGAKPVRDAVQATGVPPVTLLGVHAKELRTRRCTVSVTDLVTPP